MDAKRERETNAHTFKISLAALDVLSETLEDPLLSEDNVFALIQPRMKDFQDCKERSANKLFLES